MKNVLNAHRGCVAFRQQATGIPVSDIHCPPVWGFIGVGKFVDVDQTAYRVGERSAEESTDDDSTVHRFADRERYKYLRRLSLQSNGLSEAVNGERGLGEKYAPVSKSMTHYRFRVTSRVW